MCKRVKKTREKKTRRDRHNVKREWKNLEKGTRETRDATEKGKATEEKGMRRRGKVRRMDSARSRQMRKMIDKERMKEKERKKREKKEKDGQRGRWTEWRRAANETGRRMRVAWVYLRLSPSCGRPRAPPHPRYPCTLLDSVTGPIRECRDFVLFRSTTLSVVVRASRRRLQFFTRSRDTTSRRDASCSRAIVPFLEVRERHAREGQRRARECALVSCGHMWTWCGVAPRGRDARKLIALVEPAIFCSWFAEIRVNLCVWISHRLVRREPNTEKVWSASMSGTRRSRRYLIDDDCQVGVSRYDHSRDACLEVSFAKKSCRSSFRWPTGIDVFSCAVMFMCNGAKIPRIERFEGVCSEWKLNAREWRQIRREHEPGEPITSAFVTYFSRLSSRD